MTIRRIALVAGLGAALAGGLATVVAQRADVDRELEEAKALYREANFSDAIIKLQAAIGRLKLLQDLTARKIQLADAYLHLALSYFALDDRAAAKDTLKGMLRLDRERRLDPQIYAPPVLELLEDARREVAAEAASPPRAASTPTPPTAAKGKGGSKTLPILLGGGAAAAGVVVAMGGASSGTMPRATATPTPTPTALPTTRNIVLLGTNPPPGSTISVGASPPDLLIATVSLLMDETNDFSIGLWAMRPNEQDLSTTCAFGVVTLRLTAGSEQTVSVPMSYRFNPGCTPFPVTTNRFKAYLQTSPSKQRRAYTRSCSPRTPSCSRAASC